MYENIVSISFNEKINKYVGSIKYNCNSEGANCECFVSFLSTNNYDSDTIELIGFNVDDDVKSTGKLAKDENGIFIQFETIHFFYCQRFLDLEGGLYLEKSGDLNKNVLYPKKEISEVYESDVFSSAFPKKISPNVPIEILDRRDSWVQCREIDSEHSFWLPLHNFRN